MKDKINIIKKIKALLQKQGSDSANEANVALQKARLLMEKHGLTYSDISINTEIGTFAVNAADAKKCPDYIVCLGECVMKLFDCEFYHQIEPKVVHTANGSRLKWSHSFVFVGFSPN